MKNGTLAIYDSDIDYLHHLSEYLRLRDDFPYDIIVFSDLSAFNKFSLQPIDILITSYIPEFINEKDIGDVFYLTGENISTYKNYVCLFKYQPADILLREIMDKSHSGLKNTFISTKKHCSIIGVHSPINRCGKTSLSISLALALSEKSPTLLISFDSFSVLKCFAGNGSCRDISDLLFYFKENSDIFKSKLLSLTYKFFDLNFICPPAAPDRILSVDITDWYTLINAIADSGIYSHIVFDIPDLFAISEDFFNMCDIIYMPELRDYISSKKLEHFLEYISYSASIDTKIFKRITLPEYTQCSFKEAYIKRISQDSLYNFAKSLISNIFYDRQEAKFEHT